MELLLFKLEYKYFIIILKEFSVKLISSELIISKYNLFTYLGPKVSIAFKKPEHEFLEFVNISIILKKSCLNN